jgi:dsRNA-specific ribonuclease
VCLRITQTRRFTRGIDGDGTRAFVDKASAQSAKSLLQRPQRDTYAYDFKPPINFLSPAIPALHARIGLPESFPYSTLRRCLIDPSTEKAHSNHNEALSVVGSGLLEYYVSEYLCVRWPRLPMKTQVAALWACTGERALARIAREWGVQSELGVKTAKGGATKVTFEQSPLLVVKPPETEAAKLQFEMKQSMEWETREKAKQGWLEPKGTLEQLEFLKAMDSTEYEQRFVLFALQRFVQSLIGGLYVHSVLHLPSAGTMWERLLTCLGNQGYEIVSQGAHLLSNFTSFITFICAGVPRSRNNSSL